jgi:hypothetical protein
MLLSFDLLIVQEPSYIIILFYQPLLENQRKWSSQNVLAKSVSNLKKNIEQT